MQKVFPKATLVHRQDLTPNLIIIRLEPHIPYLFIPGQYCTIGIDGVLRPYSIASTPQDSYLELFIRCVKNGTLTSKLWDLRVGDEVTLLPKAKGIFTLEEKFEHHIMISTATGLAPFMSIIRNYFRTRGPSDRHHNFFVFQGVSYQDELGYADELKAFYPELTFIPAVSRPRDPRNTGWNGFGKRINRFSRWLLMDLGISPEDSIIYLCGNPDMVNDLSQKLTAHSFLKRINTRNPCAHRIPCFPDFKIKLESFWTEKNPA